MVSVADVGRSLPPVVAKVEPGRLRFFHKVTGETNPVFLDGAAAKEAGYADLPIPPTYLFCLEMLDAAEPFAFIDMLGVEVGRILHGEQGFTYLAPVVVGDTLTFSTRIVDIAEKKGGALTIVTFFTEVENQSGVKVAEVNKKIVVRNGEGGR